MPSSKVVFDDALYQYLLSISSRETDALRVLREEIVSQDVPNMAIQPEQGQFLAFLISLMSAKRILELGTFMGYSTAWMANALPDDGHIITCDVNQEWSKAAKNHWQRMGLANKITSHIGPALECMEDLLAEEVESFDIIFVDADKRNYPLYYEKSLLLLRKKGLVIFDNVFRGGKVLDENNQALNINVIRKFNSSLLDDPRIELSVVPIGDGMALGLKV
ncbi:MAG: O-methyltransferase [Gammaproteobacteria bacterium]